MNVRAMVAWLVIGASSLAAAEGRDYAAELMAITNHDEFVAYIDSLTVSEALQLASQGFHKGWGSYAVGRILGRYYFGENFEKHTLSRDELRNAITNRMYNPRLRSAMVRVGLHLSAKWPLKERLHFLEFIIPVLRQADMPAEEKGIMVEYSYRAFSNCVSAIRNLPDADVTKKELLDRSHICARRMMEAFLSLHGGDMRNLGPDNSTVSSLRNLVKMYLRGDFPESEEYRRTRSAAQHALKFIPSGQKRGHLSGVD